MKCEKCKSKKLKTLRVYRWNDKTERDKHCEKCKNNFKTIEITYINYDNMKYNYQKELTKLYNKISYLEIEGDKIKEAIKYVIEYTQ